MAVRPPPARDEEIDLARVRTTYGRFVQAAGWDPLEDILARTEQARIGQRHAGPRLPDAPPGRALVAGLGRLGSWVGLFLAHLGIPLVLLDRDVVERHNLEAGNCVFRSSDVGSPKVVAMKNLLAQQAPGVSVEVYQGDITLMPEDQLRALGELVRVILALVDEGQALFNINDLFCQRLAVIYAAGHRGARTGDVGISRPGGACFRCLLNIDSPAQVQTLSGEATHGIDIVSIAQVCVRVALVLLGDQRLGNLREVLDPAVNFIYIQNRRSETNPGGFAPRFLRIARRRNCPVCGAV